MGNAVIQTKEGNYVATGVTKSYDSGNADAWVVCVDSKGNQIWENRPLRCDSSANGFSVVETSDGHYVIAGDTTCGGSGGNDLFVIKIDSGGNATPSETKPSESQPSTGAMPPSAEDSKYFEITGGRSESVPIQINAVQMVQGELIIQRTGTINLIIADSSGKPIFQLIETSTQGSFYYRPGSGGQYYLVATNPDGGYIGTIGCTVKYSIVAAPDSVPLGSASGPNLTSPAPQPPPSSPVNVWIIVAVVVIMAIMIPFGARRARSSRGAAYYDDEDDDEEPEDVYIHRRTVRCPDCDGTGTVPSLYIPRARVKCRNCKGTGRLFD